MPATDPNRRQVLRWSALAASSIPRGPVARVPLPQRVPYGFHGTWVPA